MSTLKRSARTPNETFALISPFELESALPLLQTKELSMSSRFLDLQNPIAFARLFGTEENKELSIHLLNDMVAFRKGEPIVNVTPLKSNIDPEAVARKRGVVDLLCQDGHGNRYLVELQVVQGESSAKEELYYAAKGYCSQPHAVDGEIEEMVFLSIHNHPLFPGKEVKSQHGLLEKESRKRCLGGGLSYLFIELSKFRKEVDQLKDRADRWYYLLKCRGEIGEKELFKICNDDPIIERAFSELNLFSWHEADRFAYKQWEKYAHSPD